MAEGPHHSCAALKMVGQKNSAASVQLSSRQAVELSWLYLSFQINWSSKAITTVVDIVKRPKRKSNCLESNSTLRSCTMTGGHGYPHAHTLLAMTSIAIVFLPLSPSPPLPLSPSLAGQFPGFYAVFLPERCWDSRGQRVVLNDQWGSLQVRLKSECRAKWCLFISFLLCSHVTHKKFKLHAIP